MNFVIFPINLPSYFETDEKLTLVATFQFTWLDPRIKWDRKKKYNQTSVLVISSDDIWLPHVYLRNSMNEIRPIGHDSEFYAFIFETGKIIWASGASVEAQCTPNIYKFPFDTQRCALDFMLWSLYPGIEFHVPLEKPDLTHFIENSDWQLVEAKLTTYPSHPIFTVDLTIKRNSLYNVVAVVLPTLLFSFMNPLMFCVPTEASERISLGMTILMAYAIFLTIVSSSIPAKSNPICVLIVILVLIMIVSGRYYYILSHHYNALLLQSRYTK